MTGRKSMPEQPLRSAYAAGAEMWNSPIMRPWAEQHERMDRALAGLAEAALELAAAKPEERVIDIGCGSGTTVLELAARVAPGGQVLGIDIAAASVARANERLAAAGVRHAEAVVADASQYRFADASADLVFSRLGVMFFDDPVAAFANIHQALKPGGRSALAVFRGPGENPWPNAPLAAVADLLPPLPPPEPGMPGMFAWSDPDRVRQILEAAGFTGVTLTPVDTVLQLADAGGTAEAAEFATIFGPLARLMPGWPAAGRAEVRRRLEAFFARYATPQGVGMPAAFWVVQARA
jgi:SAM-dependent methyltransferase